MSAERATRCLGRPSLVEIRAALEAEFGKVNFRGPRTRSQAELRFAFYWLARSFGHSEYEVSTYARVDRSSVSHGWRRACELIDTEARWRRDIEELASKIKARAI